MSFYKKNIQILLVTFMSMTGCSNQNGLTDEDYKDYQLLGAPKIIYSCTEEVEAWEKCILHEDKTPEECNEQGAFEDKKVKVSQYGYSAGLGMNATYNHIVTEAKGKCKGDFEILESEK